MLIAASTNAANVTADSASPSIRSSSGGTPTRDRSHDFSSVNGHVGPVAVAGGRGER